MFHVYIIYAETMDKIYIGSCQNLENRVQDHLNKRSKFTKITKDWALKYSEKFETRSEAVQRELKIEKMKSRIYIEKLILKN
jgi:putative endonuclease